ncbi:hypothetical protein FOZ60_006415 [Perkinsus olseni]|uniref:N-acetyltransferase domain-containing protein n=2 Tax=Perkinsus olseni TaxID=32597 RepID=A0A7J6NPD6_PEROL|nr:hypothetical protein FOZ60_006415 [Perkinsus olseni]
MADPTELDPVLQRLQGDWIGLPTTAAIRVEGRKVNFNGVPLLGRLVRHSDGRVSISQWVAYPEKENRPDEELTWYIISKQGPVESTRWVRSLPQAGHVDELSRVRRSSSLLQLHPPCGGNARGIENARLEVRAYSSGVTAGVPVSPNRWTLRAEKLGRDMTWLKNFVEKILVSIGAATKLEDVSQAAVSCSGLEFIIWCLSVSISRVREGGNGVEEKVRGPNISGTLCRQMDGQVESAALLLCWKDGVFSCKRLQVQSQKKDGKLCLRLHHYELSSSTLREWHRGEASLEDGCTLKVMRPTRELAEVVHTNVQANSFHLGRYLSGLVDDCRTVDRARWLLSRWYHDHVAGTGVHLGLFDRSGSFLGVSEVERRPLHDEVVGVVEYWLTRDACGKGLAQRMFQATMKYAVQELGITTFHLDIHPDNITSAETAMKSGGKQAKSRKESRGQGGRYAVTSTQTFDVFKIDARGMGPSCGSIEASRRFWMGPWVENRVATGREKMKELKKTVLHIGEELAKDERDFEKFGLSVSDRRMSTARAFIEWQRGITEAQTQLSSVERRISNDQETIDRLTMRTERLNESQEMSRRRLSELEGLNKQSGEQLREVEQVKSDLAELEQKRLMVKGNITELERRLSASKEWQKSLKAIVDAPRSIPEADGPSRRAVVALERVESRRAALVEARQKGEEQSVKLANYDKLRSAAKLVEKLTAASSVSFDCKYRADSRARAVSADRTSSTRAGRGSSARRTRSAERQWYYPDVPHPRTLGDWYNVLVSCLQRGFSSADNEFWLVLVVSSYQQACQGRRRMWLEFLREIHAGRVPGKQLRCSVLDLSTAGHESREKLVSWLDLGLFDLPQLRVLRGQDRFVYTGEAEVEAVCRFLDHLPPPVNVKILPPSKGKSIGRF